MKKIYFLTGILVICSLNLHAQGIYQFWGLTKDGGTDNAGTIFNTRGNANNFQERKQFNITNPGASPQFTNLAEYNGKFYGMTQQGGSSNLGVIFEYDPATNTYTKKKDFNEYDGSGPLGSLVLYAGKFYGMTEFGGTEAQGVIFEWDPSTNLYTKKFDFADNFTDGYNGYRPAGNLAVSNGKLYGMTTYGGSDDKGVIFEFDPANNVYTKKKEFTGANGASPYGSMVLKTGKFYGMTTFGGSNDKGVIFEWNPSSNVYSKRKDFTGSNGSFPFGNLVIKGGVFISVTQDGGSHDEGVIFEWNPVTNVMTKKYDFDGEDGYWPSGDLALKDGKYYGTAFRGGNHDKGVIFEWNPSNNQYAKKIDLDSEDGKYPQAGMSLMNGKFYGMGVQGGVTGQGVIFEWNPSNNQYAKKIDLNDTRNGIIPTGRLTSGGGKMYGMTNSGGNQNAGIIFEFNSDGNTSTKKVDLTATGGSKPTGSLAGMNGKFYGMTRNGGENDMGVIFEFDPANGEYTKKIDLVYENGSFPQGSLVAYNGKFYGMTSEGGANGAGVIFEWNPANNEYSNKVDFAYEDGSKPYGEMAIYNGKFYGITNLGGSNNSGVIFEWNPANNHYSKQHDFGGSAGEYPYGSLTLYNNKFYGMASEGGLNDKGVIFEWNPAGNVYTKKMDFSATDAFNPLGNLTVSGSSLYGMTRFGGVHFGGVLFEWNPLTDTYTKKNDLEIYSGGILPGIITDLTLSPAPVAKGIPGTCANFEPVTIDETNNNVWVPITDDKGDAVAEIKANGNNLGLVTISMFINDNNVREGAASRLYLDRNLTITPAVQPLSAVDIRLYIKDTEYQALKNAVNSEGESSGIHDISDVGIYKNEDGCSAMLLSTPDLVPTTAEAWQADHVLSASIQSFSSFYFANKAQGGPVPITTLELNAKLVDENADIVWKTTDEYNTASFELERSIDGISYKAISNVSAVNQLGTHYYKYFDKNIVSLGARNIFYRVRENDRDGKFSYSGIVVLGIKSNTTVALYPNPVAEKVNVSISSTKAELLNIRIIDNAGRIIRQQQWNVSASSNSLSIQVSNLAKGMYYLELKGKPFWNASNL